MSNLIEEIDNRYPGYAEAVAAAAAHHRLLTVWGFMLESYNPVTRVITGMIFNPITASRRYVRIPANRSMRVPQHVNPHVGALFAALTPKQLAEAEVNLFPEDESIRFIYNGKFTVVRDLK